MAWRGTETRAAELYRQAADQGYPPALCSLGLCYERGDGVEKDKAKAAEWYRRAAERGDAPRPVQPGLLLSDGIGTKRDPRKAVKWFQKAADQGLLRAIDLLGDCYLNGDGVEQGT